MTATKDGVSLKDFLVKINEWLKFLLSKWIIILAIALTGGALGYWYAAKSKVQYIGKLNFVLSDNSGGSGSGLLGLAGLAGVALPGSGNGAFEGDNIVELLKSQKIVRRSLFQMLPDSSDVLMNLMAMECGVMEKWKKISYLNKQLPFPKYEASLTPIQDSLYQEMHGTIVKRFLLIDKSDKKLNFFNVQVKTSQQWLSVLFARSLVNIATDFYIETKTKAARSNLDMLQKEADSLRYALGGAVTSAAAAADQTFNLNAALQINRTSIQKNQLQAQVLGAAYGEVIKNLEMAKIALQKETPLVQVIDEPSIPLKALRKSTLIYFLAGCFFFGGIAVCFLLGRKIIRDILNG